MTDIYDFTEYIKSLKKGFDKDEFKEKVEDLAIAVDGPGLEYDEFHNLFKVWLNLSIPVTKWMDIGAHLVPRDRVEGRTIEYALRWLLANNQNQISFSRIGFVLDWLTAAMVCDSVDMTSLDTGYEVFYMLLSFEMLTPHTMKLVYTLTKPRDVTRWRVLELIEIAKKREAKKSKCRQIQILLGLFKSYKPECVPESVPAFSVHTNFRKINADLLGRFDKSQALRNNTSSEKMRLNWVNPLNDKGSKKAEPLIPNLEFCHMGSKQYSSKQQKTFLDIEDHAALLEMSRRRALARPARLRALLLAEVGLALLAAAPRARRAFLAHELRHTLDTCFLQPSPHSYSEKRFLLQRLAALQRTLLRGEPVVTMFLAQYLPFWNEADFFHEILALIEWLSVESPAHVGGILRGLGRGFLRAAPLARCAVLTCLARLYDNLAYSSTRTLHQEAPRARLAPLLAGLAAFTADLANKWLQVTPDDMRALAWAQRSAAALARSQLAGGPAAPPPPPPRLAVALPLLAPSAALLDGLAELMLLYKQIYSKIRKSSTNRETEDQVWTLQAYTADMIGCLWSEQVLSDRNTGHVFSKLPLPLVEKLKKSVPNPDGALSLRSHIAFAGFVHAEGINLKDTDNKMWFDTVVEPQFYHLSRFLRKVAPELRG